MFYLFRTYVAVNALYCKKGGPIGRSGPYVHVGSEAGAQHKGVSLGVATGAEHEAASMSRQQARSTSKAEHETVAGAEYEVVSIGTLRVSLLKTGRAGVGVRTNAASKHSSANLSIEKLTQSVETREIAKPNPIHQCVGLNILIYFRNEEGEEEEEDFDLIIFFRPDPTNPT
jgi:hypothetical protein